MTERTVLLALLVLALRCAHGQTDAQTIPAYLALARELVENSRPENNRYVLGGTFVATPADAPGTAYAVGADCSGFLLAILERARHATRARMAYVPDGRRRTRPAAEDFVHSIELERGFRRILDVRRIRPGDLLAHAMLDAVDRQRTGTTGHVFLIDAVPRRIAPRNPVVAGTEQYEVAVIDSNEETVGDDDTRRNQVPGVLRGLGRGTIRLYADESGQLVGWARTFRETRRFFSYDPRFPSDTRRRKAAVGRPGE